ncbi:SRPBCC family protein [Nocardia thailandica]|uniref:hypothetical protein n=1 Tax=Nocardia thailandica TaxID=257275 RepID=UPI0002FFCC41|nr:hypothetical protein [Nocardia thailandica]
MVPADADHVMDALIAVERMPEWSAFYHEVRAGNRDARGRPLRAFVSGRLGGRSDDQVLGFSWTDRSVTWWVDDSIIGARSRGWFRLTSQPPDTVVDYHAELHLPLPIPGVFYARTLHRAATDAAARFAAFAESYWRERDFSTPDR